MALLGRGYYDNATDNPHLYRVMFMEEPLDAADAAARSETFDLVVAGVRRCIASGRFGPADPADLATQFWAVGHGVVALELAHLLSPEEALRCSAGALLNLFTAYGDDRDAARQSILRARPATGPDLEPAAAGEIARRTG